MTSELEVTPDEQELIEFHHRANAEVFARMADAGFDFTATVTVDFQCLSTSLEDAAELANLLMEKYGYDVEVFEREAGDETSFLLQGKRHGVTLARDFMDKWCQNMVIICSDFGCQYDGWGVRY